jgi:hypothetical protein
MDGSTSRARTTVRVAAAILVALGIGHLALMGVVAGARMAGWVESGLWGAVPLRPGPDPDETALLDSTAFWSGIGSFAVPLVVLGLLLWWLTGRGVVPPAFVGWTLTAWFVVGGVVLVPSPMFVGALAGLLLVLAARIRERPAETVESDVSRPPALQPSRRRTSSSRP